MTRRRPRAIAKAFSAGEKKKTITIDPAKLKTARSDNAGLDRDVEKVQRTVNDAMIKMLLNKQRATYKKMLGEPLDFEKLTSSRVETDAAAKPLAAPAKAAKP